MNKLLGLLAATYTPVNSKGNVNLSMIGSYAEYLKINKLKGAFINGSTGDFTGLSTAERMLIVEEWSKHKSDDMVFIVHVGCNSLKEACLMAKQANGLQMHGISAIAPFYFKPKNVYELVEYSAEISASAPDIPFYYYHIPQLTNLDFDMVEYLRIGKDLIPNLGGVKYSKIDLVEYRKCIELDDGAYDILFGSDENILPALVMGSRGFVGSTYNHIPRLYQNIINAVKNKDLSKAAELQSQSIKFIDILLQFGFHGAGKSVMKHIGLDFGGNRLPHKSLDKQAERKLLIELEKAGFFPWFTPIYA